MEDLDWGYIVNTLQSELGVSRAQILEYNMPELSCDLDWAKYYQDLKVFAFVVGGGGLR